MLRNLTEEWRDLIHRLERLEQTLATDADPERATGLWREAVKDLAGSAAMLGLEGLDEVSEELEALFERTAASGSFEEDLPLIRRAVDKLIREIREVLEAAAPGGEEAEFADLATAVEKLGGRLIRPSRDGHERRLEIEFPMDHGILNRVEACLLFHDVTASVSGSTADEGEVLEEVIDGIKEFMTSFAAGNVERAQQILLDIAQCRHPALYKEIGLLARELHTSLRDFQLKLDPALKEIVQERLPDSGNRLEHIIQLTENAANVTMDHVEAIQRRNEEDRGRASRLRELAQALYPVGDQAARRLEGILSEVTELEADLSKNHEDLLTILTAQDYQDLTGQIILKIIRLLNDLEDKLLHLIKSFGVRVESETGRRSSEGELYGPAHKDVESALHSQDDVDAMLAEFGF
ncbi:protein phosphatase CheZ [Desulfoglaeba alkanexedens]|uniref:Protein phosphatase CheZ n=1 Tax=Desulfoglaeba alkanexedens ALDC TaxID=980445 RepID=A0A4V1ERS7_9BACT|nr:protein phosphatase CheZ [Desulfoglaeba alkanexedens]QCQ22681.1 hypothetical protein FDQ92_11175 [Desulfoglaeba alkanexedens ALDC]